MKSNEKRIFAVTIVFSLVILAVMVVYNFVSFYRSLVNDAELVGENSIIAEINQIETYLGQGSNTLKVSAMTVDFMLSQKKSPEEIEKYLKYQTKQFQEHIDENFTGVYGYINGTYIDGSDWVPDDDYVPTEREWYTAAVEAGGEVVLIPPYVDAMTHEVIVSVCSLLSDGKSVLSIDIVLNRVQEITENINLNNVGYGFITDRDGVVISHRSSSEIGKDYFNDNAEMRQLLDRAASEKHFDMNISGEKNYVFTGKTSDNWTVVMIISGSTFFKPVRSILFRNILIVIMVYAAVIIFSTFSLRRMEQSMAEIDKRQEEVDIANENLKRSHNAINTIAYTNILTDFKNRYALQDDITKKYKGHKLDIAYFDIDNFHKVNEKYGYEAGDDLLYIISEKIKEEIKEEAEIYNIFGDNFCIIFDRDTSDVTNERVEEITDSIFKIMTRAYHVQTFSIKVTVSAFLYHHSAEDVLNINKLLKKLDHTVKEIKKNGGNACRI